MKIISQTPDMMVIKHSIFFPVLVYLGITAFCILSIIQKLSEHSFINLLPFLLLGFLFLLLACTVKAVTVNLNKATGELLYKSGSIFNKHQIEANLKDVNRVEIRAPQRFWAFNIAQLDSGAIKSNVISMQSVIILNDGTELPLEDPKMYRNPLSRLFQKAQLGFLPSLLMGTTPEVPSAYNPENVAKFIGVPFTESSRGSNLGFMSSD